MELKVLKTKTDYQKAIRRTLEIFHAEEGTPEDDELAVLLLLVKDYEEKHVTIPQISPVDIIKQKMREQGIRAKDLEPIIGSKGHVSSVLSGRREITLKVAQRLKEFFHLPSEVFLPSV
jgi:HTH-type transcriptional regulator / antitoxin HigA